MKRFLFILLIPFLTGCIEVEVQGFLNTAEDFYLVSTDGDENSITSHEFNLYGKFDDDNKDGYLELKINKQKYKFPFELNEGEVFEENLVNINVSADESGQPFDFQFNYKYHLIDQMDGSEHRACTYQCGTSNNPRVCNGYQWIRYTVNVYQEESTGQFNDGSIEAAEFTTSKRYLRRYDDFMGTCR